MPESLQTGVGFFEICFKSKNRFDFNYFVSWLNSILTILKIRLLYQSYLSFDNNFFVFINKSAVGIYLN